MAQHWCKVASNLDSHPKIRKAGRLGREVFLFALRRNAEPGNPVPGRLPKDELEPWYVADQLQMDVTEAVTGVTAAVTAGLLAEDGHSYVIVSWKDGWGKGSGSSAERMQRFRQNKKLEICDKAGDGSDTRDVTGDGGDTDKKRRDEKRTPCQVDLDLTADLFARIIKNNPRSSFAKLTPADLEKKQAACADEVRKMREIDGHSEAEIRQVIAWCQSDPFWHTNILSTKKLRLQWNALVAKMGRGPSTTHTKATSYEQPTLTFRIGDVEVER